MKILIVTSKDHIYANYLLRSLFERGSFTGHTVMIWEQDAIVPGKGRIAGLWRYIRRSGIRYTLAQTEKQLVFVFLRWWATLTGNTESTFYPYYVPRRDRVSREVYGGMKSDAAYIRVKTFSPDLLLSLFSKEIIPERILRVPRKAAVNLHPALLPAFRGVSPIFWAMATGAKRIGITLHTLDIGIDTGAIISQKASMLRPGETEHSAYLRLTKLGVDLLVSYLHHIHSGPKPKRRHTTPAPYYSLPTKEAVTALYNNGYAIVRLTEML